MTIALSSLLGVEAEKVPAALADLAGGDVDPADVTVAVVPYPSGSPATGGLWRVGAGGRSFFVKLLHHVRHWPGLQQMPPPLAAQFSAEFPWRTELELWDPRIQATLPPGLRSPVLHRLIDLGDDRLALWQEDVPAAPWAYRPELFDRAAYLLGRWNARCAAPDILAVSSYPPGFALRMYAERSVPFRGLAPLDSDEAWQHPWLAGHGDVRAGLRELGPRIPAMLDRLDTWPQTLPHGDASPQNLLIPPVGDPAELVAIDVSFRTPHALGFDLGQLLVGLIHAGEIPADRLPAIAAVIEPAYLRGLADDGITGVDEQVRDAFATSVLLRSGFDGFRYDLLAAADPAERDAFDERVALSRFLIDLYRCRSVDAVP